MLKIFAWKINEVNAKSVYDWQLIMINKITGAKCSSDQVIEVTAMVLDRFVKRRGLV